MLWLKRIFWSTIIITVTPILIALLAVPISYLAGCNDSGGSAGTCTFGGAALGEIVWTMSMMPWFTLLLFMPAVIICSGALIGMGVLWLRRRR